MVQVGLQSSRLRVLPALVAARAILLKMRNYRHARFRREVALTNSLVSTVGLFFGLAVSSPASAATGNGSSGSFAFSGYISGTLKVPAFLPSSDHTDCSITASNLRTDIPDTDVFNWNEVELKVGGKSKKISFIDLQLQVSKFGRTLVMAAPKEGSSNSVFFSTGALYNWLSESGSITTAKSGKSGSVKGMLSAGANHSGTITIKGHCAGCTILSN
jgi:hypothetical protein